MTDLALPNIQNLLPKAQLDKARQEQIWRTKKVDEAAVEFESQFLGLMIENMFTDLENDGPFGGGNGETIYRSFMTEEYAKSIAQSGGIGIAKSVRAELLRMQEVADGKPEVSRMFSPVTEGSDA